MRKLCLISTCAAALFALPNLARAIPTVAAGTDYFQTEAGTNFNFGGPIGIVNFAGDPFGPGSTDTVVRRQADAIINGPQIPIQMTGLQLVSTAPVLGFGNINIYISLDPTQLAGDIGTMSIAGGLTGGTFTSSLVVNFDVCTAPGVNGVGCGNGTLLMTNSLALANTGALWLPDPPAQAVIVAGTYPDLGANLHFGLPVDFVDFFPLLVDEAHPQGAGDHIVDPALPEPASLFLLGSGLLGLAGLRNRQRRARRPE